MGMYYLTEKTSQNAIQDVLEGTANTVPDFRGYPDIYPSQRIEYVQIKQ